MTDHTGQLLRLTADDRDATTPGALHPLSFGSDYVMPADGVLYLCLVNLATTVAELAGTPMAPSQVEPVLAGQSTTVGQTGPASAPTAFCLPSTCGAGMPYAVLG